MDAIGIRSSRLQMHCIYGDCIPYRTEVTMKRYAGCMKDIEVSRTPYNLLSSSDYTGLTKGCAIEVCV